MEGKSPCGMVTVTLTGQQMPVSCDISEEAMAEGAKVLGEKVRNLLSLLFVYSHIMIAHHQELPYVCMIDTYQEC